MVLSKILEIKLDDDDIDKVYQEGDDAGDGSDVIIVMCDHFPLYHQSASCPVTLSPTLSQTWAITLANYNSLSNQTTQSLQDHTSKRVKLFK